MKKFYSLLLTAVALPLLWSCGGDDPEDNHGEQPATASLVLRSQSIAEGAELNADDVQTLTLTYNTLVSVSSSADIRLNGTSLKATSNATTAMSVDIALTLEEGTSYTLKIAEGAFVARDNNKQVSPELTIHFTTREKAKPVNPDIAQAPVAATTDAAQKLYSYLVGQYGQKTISSIMADVNWNHKIADQVGAAVGKYPAMNCYDFIHIYVPKNNWIDYTNISPVTEWANAGGIVQLMWHFNVPLSETTTPGSDGSGVTCTPTETTFKASNALVSGTWENKWFYEQMDKVVSVILQLQDAGIAATWRPFHEAAGNATAKQQASWTKSWFWWGYDGAETYKQLWHAMFDYFKQKGVKNLIWVWTTQNYNGNADTYNQDTDWYPGSEYVDIVARDIYPTAASRPPTSFPATLRSSLRFRPPIPTRW